MKHFQALFVILAAARFCLAQADYLRRDYPCEVTRVEVGEKQVRIEGRIGGEAKELFLAEVPAHLNALEATEFPFVEPIRANGEGFALTVERKDRLLSRWAVVRQSAKS